MGTLGLDVGSGNIIMTCGRCWMLCKRFGYVDSSIGSNCVGCISMDELNIDDADGWAGGNDVIPFFSVT
ncbi:hypothetical protein An16g05040 [Aspergillus niger]|uniref:Uncharacterized protein n=2 Tax=Aspergillus niger TaxID=5061 RepID=A2R7X0_ASPNC|nr:hypothetical protein An16g05040 [Aspergillus niger]CAK97358.1 hypothetical protein An16g05040 [Aspergillus niger]